MEFQTSPEPLRELLERLEQFRHQREAMLDNVALCEHNLKLAKNDLLKIEQKIDTVRETIMVEKKLLDASK